MTYATLIANAGILLEIDGIRFLIDGLHHSSQYPFSPVPQAMLDQMLRGEGPFRDADFLLFTHDHPDHWSPALTQAYLQANRVRRVLLPPRSKDGPAQDALTADMTARHIPWWQADLHRGQRHTYLLAPEVYLTALSTPHEGEMFAHLDCLCLLLTVHGQHYLITGDCDWNDPSYYDAIADIRPRAVFVNPLFFYDPAGRALLSRWTPPQVVLYHIPFAGEDSISLRTLTRQCLTKYSRDFESVQTLWEPEQRIEL